MGTVARRPVLLFVVERAAQGGQLAHGHCRVVARCAPTVFASRAPASHDAVVDDAPRRSVVWLPVPKGNQGKACWRNPWPRVGLTLAATVSYHTRNAGAAHGRLCALRRRPDGGHPLDGAPRFGVLSVRLVGFSSRRMVTYTFAVLQSAAGTGDARCFASAA